MRPGASGGRAPPDPTPLRDQGTGTRGGEGDDVEQVVSPRACVLRSTTQDRQRPRPVTDLAAYTARRPPLRLAALS